MLPVIRGSAGPTRRSVGLLGAGQIPVSIIAQKMVTMNLIISSVPVKTPEGGLSVLSFIKCDDIRSVSKQRLKKFYGTVSARTLAEVELRMRILLNL